MKVDFEQFKEDYDVALVVLSRDRAKSLAENTDKLLRGYHLFYSGEGYDDIDYHCVERTEVPRGLHGLSLVRNFVLDRLKQNVVIFVDDDLMRISYVHGERTVALTPEQIKLVWIDLVIHALDQDVGAFGLSELDIRKTSPLKPFETRAVFGSAIGVIGRQWRFDERNVLKCDYDFCLQTLVDKRLVHKDLRYYAAAKKDAGAGGNMQFRTPGRRQQEIERLQRWWGKDVVVPGKAKFVEKLSIKLR